MIDTQFGQTEQRQHWVQCKLCTWESYKLPTREQAEQARDEHLRAWHAVEYARVRTGISDFVAEINRMLKPARRPTKDRRPRSSTAGTRRPASAYMPIGQQETRQHPHAGV